MKPSITVSRKTMVDRPQKTKVCSRLDGSMGVRNEPCHTTSVRRMRNITSSSPASTRRFIRLLELSQAFTGRVLAEAWVPAILLLLLCAGAQLRAQPAAPVSYTTFEGKKLSLYPWMGSKVAVLTASPNLDPATMKSILNALDGAWRVYEQVTGMEPFRDPATTLNGLDIIAEVPNGSTCGAACSYVGSTGTQIESTWLSTLY